MTNPNVALQTPNDVTEETIRELFDHVDSDTASEELVELTEMVADNPDEVIDTGERHPDRTKDEPCPECGNEELYFLQTISDTYVCTGDETIPGDSGQNIESTVMVECIECGETLYRRPGIEG